MNPAPKRYSFREILFIPIGCAMQMPFIPVLVLLGVLIIGSFAAYQTLNYDPIHLWSRSYPDYALTADLTGMSDTHGNTWQISYENLPPSTFTGLVRHISPDEESLVPMLTYDILVTSGDYANSDLVHTVVVNHMFTWKIASNFHPVGKINLLHTVAKDRATFEKLRAIQNGEKVKVSGLEIYKIDALDPAGKYLGYWMDEGCNTLLVTDVEIQ